MKKQKWIDGVLQSAKDIKPVSSDPYLATKVIGRLQTMPTFGRRMSLTSFYASIAAVIVIVAVNIFVWKISSKTTDETGVRQLIREYRLGNDAYSLNYSN